MATAKMFKMDGAEAGTIDLTDAVFNVPSNASVVHEAVVALQNAKRQGNAETKVRHEVSGGGAKPYRQKGTGRARRGSSREPHMRGGGTIFGPHKRSYRQAISPTVKRKALCCVLSDRVREEALCVLDQLAVETPKTKPFAEMVSRLRAGHERTLIVTADTDRAVYLSARNIPRVEIRTAADLNVLDIVLAKRVVVARDAVTKLEERLS